MDRETVVGLKKTLVTFGVIVISAIAGYGIGLVGVEIQENIDNNEKVRKIKREMEIREVVRKLSL